MEVLRFEHIEYLWLLLIIPVMAILYLNNRYWRKGAIAKFGDTRLVERLIPDRSIAKRRLKFVFLMISLTFIILAFANPQVGTEKGEATRKGIDVMIALDVSNSMLAQDITPNRLERARQFIIRLIDKMENDRVGLIIFAGNAYLQMPLTVDHAAAKVFLKTISTETVPTQGTALSQAIKLSREAFIRNEKKHKALILITDGEDHEEGVLEEAELASGEGLPIFPIGVGSPTGAPIPEIIGGYSRGYKKDREGNIILSKLDETTLNKIALIANGKYFHFSGSNDQLSEIKSGLDAIESKDLENVSVESYVSYYQIPLILGLLFLLLDLFITFKKSKLMARWWTAMEV